MIVLTSSALRLAVGGFVVVVGMVLLRAAHPGEAARANDHAMGIVGAALVLLGTLTMIGLT